MKAFIFALLALISVTATATPFDDYVKCTSPVFDRQANALDKAAIIYPRFGIAWNAEKATVADAIARNDMAAASEAHQQFLDRILRTAEPEAIEFYNQIDTLTQQALKACGPMPKAAP